MKGCLLCTQAMLRLTTSSTQSGEFLCQVTKSKHVAAAMAAKPAWREGMGDFVG